MYTSRVSLCIGIVGVHPSYPSSPVGFYKPIMDISTPGSMYHHSWDFFSLQPRPCGKCVLEPIAISVQRFGQRFGSYDGNQPLGIERFFWENTTFTELFRSSFRFKTVSLSLCTTAGMLKMIQTFEFHRLHRWTLRYIATEDMEGLYGWEP